MQAPVPTVEEPIAEPLCLAFANTVSYRRGPKRADRLAGPDELRAWLSASDLASEGIGGTDPQRHFERAIRLREAVYGLCSAASARSQPDEADLFTLNVEVREALLHARIVATEGGFAWDLSRLRTPNGALGIIALSAANLLSGPLSGRVRECADERCGWLFMDSSKNRSRKWCSMSDCGNLAKARRHYAKIRKAG